jgi:hypothetical protein
VLLKRTEFVLATPDENNKISELINLPQKNGAESGNKIIQNPIQPAPEPTSQNAILPK